MKVQIVLNVPQILALQDPAGVYNPTMEEVSYPCTDGRILTLDTRSAERLNALFLRPDETFGLCRRWEQVKGSIPRFDFWLTPASEQARAAEESGNPEPQRPASIATAQPSPESPAPIPQRRQRRATVQAMPVPQPTEQPQLWDQRGNGTYGPAPRPAIHPGPGRIPMNVAFREVVQFVTLELKQSGEQWSDQSRQDLVSTIIISAGRQGLLDVWERS